MAASYTTSWDTTQAAATFPGHPDMTTKSGIAMAGMLAGFSIAQHDFKSMTWPATIPCTVIVSGHSPFSDRDERNRWLQSHIDFAHSAPSGVLLVAKGSSHMVMNDRPGLVANAVGRAILAVR